MNLELLERPVSGQTDPPVSRQSNSYGIATVSRVRVVLLDQDNLPMARGSAVLPLAFGVGIFWPDCPMPPFASLLTIKCFALPGGEMMLLKSLTLRRGYPPQYEFRMALG